MGNYCCQGTSALPQGLNAANPDLGRGEDGPRRPPSPAAPHMRDSSFTEAPAWPPPAPPVSRSSSFFEETKTSISDDSDASSVKAPQETLPNNASKDARVEKMAGDEIILGFVADVLSSLPGDDRQVIEVLRHVEENMGTHPVDAHQFGVLAEGSDDNREIRRRFDNTELGQTIRQLQAEVSTAAHQVNIAAGAFTSDPHDQELRAAYDLAEDQMRDTQLRLQNYILQNGGDAFGYAIATTANNLAIDAGADGLVGLRDLLRDYDEAIAVDNELLLGVSNAREALTNGIQRANGRNLEPPGTEPTRTTDIFELANRRNAGTIEPPGMRLDSSSGTASDDSIPSSDWSEVIIELPR